MVNVYKVSPGQSIQLVNADGRYFTSLGTSKMTITLEKLSAEHTFIIVEQLSAPVILGRDFMSQQTLILDLQGGSVYQSGSPENNCTWNSEKLKCVITDDELPQALPSKSTDLSQLDLPSDIHPALEQVIEEYKMLFSHHPG